MMTYSNRDLPDTRRKMAFAYPCWSIYTDMACLVSLKAQILAQDTIGGSLRGLGMGFYLLICLPEVGETEATQSEKTLLYTRSGDPIFIDSELYLESFFECGIYSGQKKLSYTFSNLSPSFASSMMNFLYRSCGEQILIVDPHRRICRAAQYARKNIIATPNGRNESTDISIDLTAWELNGYGAF